MYPELDALFRARLSGRRVQASYGDMARLVDRMRAEDDRVNWETLRIFGDELWNFSDGHRTVAGIGHAVCVEFGLRVDSRHFLTLAEGLERAGVLTLERR